MSAAAIQPAIYESFRLLSPDGSNFVDLYDAQFRVITFDIYENILSPYVTGAITIASSGSVGNDDKLNRDTSLRNFLPLEVGSTILVKIKPQLGQPIDYSRGINDYKFLYVDKVTTIKDSTAESYVLSFRTKVALMSDTKRVTHRYNGNIGNSVRKIVEEYLELDNNEMEITKTANEASFSGNNKRPLDLIIDMASRSVPANTSNPGYLCFETIGKFNFVSFDKLINTEPEFTYNYNGSLIATEQLKDDTNNFKVASLSFVKDQDLLSQVRTGVYSSKSIFFNSLTYSFTEIDISVVDGKLVDDPKFSSLGEKYKTPRIIESGFKESKKIHRINTKVIDIGAEKEKISKDDKNNDPEVYIAASATRYNLMFSQMINATVPCNTDLSAGSTIKIIFEDSSSDKEKGPDQTRSGKYIIQALRHHFDGNNSVTSMNLIRDSYGLHFTKTS